MGLKGGAIEAISSKSEGAGDGGGMFGDLIHKIKGEQQSPQYTYDANTQQYSAMKKGGTASSRADGCATKGKTKGRFV
jgi:hypothetical protein